METEKLTQEELKEVIDYNPDTGIFTWKESRGGRKTGDVAGCPDDNGYILIRIYGILYPAHRLAFLYMEGYFPENEVDHINRIKGDNKWINLREVSNSCNMRNTSNRRDNTSGIKGICWCNTYVKWIAYININNKHYTLGIFHDFNEAVCHRLAGEQCLDWSSCDSNSSAFDYVERWICGRRLKYPRRNYGKAQSR